MYFAHSLTVLRGISYLSHENTLMSVRFNLATAAILFVATSLTPLRVSAQSAFVDTLFYSLTRQTVEKLDITNLSVLDEVVSPQYLMDTTNGSLHEIGYFENGNFAWINTQLNNPLISTWNDPLFTEGLKVSLVEKPTKDACISISLPIVAQDGDAIIIYYEIWRGKKGKRSAFAGATIWTKTMLNTWTIQRETPMWRENW